MRRMFWLIALSLLVTSSAFAQEKKKPAKTPPDNVEYMPDVVCGKGGEKELTLNLARPKNLTAPAPCIVIIHGGGWSSGNKNQHSDATWMFAQKGYVCATIGYRLAPKDPFPAQVEDVKCAVRFLRANAEKYNLDPKRVGAIGFSAGAHLAMMLGVTDKADGLEGDGGSPDQSSKVQAVVSFFGPTDLGGEDVQPVISPILRSFLGGNIVEKPEAFKKASPITYVRADSAPMLLFQGTVDLLVPVTQAYKMVGALSKAGVDGRLEILIGRGHGWNGPELKRTIEASFAFFEEKLK